MLGSSIGGYRLVVDLGNLEEINRDASLVATSKPLRVQSPGGVILVDVDGVVQSVELVLLAPVLGILQLVESFLCEKLAGSQIAKQSLVIVARGSRASGRGVVLFRFAQVLEFLQSVQLILGEVSYMARGVLRSIRAGICGGMEEHARGLYLLGMIQPSRAGRRLEWAPCLAGITE